MGRPPIDLTGQKFGKLTAMEICEHGGFHHPVKWRCVCDCGNEKIADSQLLRQGRISDCGCGVTSRLVGKRFGRLTVVRDSGKRLERCKNILWECKCDCGNTTYVLTSNLVTKYNRTVSCGCYAAERRIKHNLTNTNSRICKIIVGMRQRCYNPNDAAYKWYGARGIRVCDEWMGEDGVENFYKWAVANGYKEDLTIDRIDVNGNYEPSNCRWATRQEQRRNTRSNRWITVNGEKRLISEWAKLKNISASTISSRIKRGMSEYDAVMTPSMAKKKKEG